MKIVTSNQKKLGEFRRLLQDNSITAALGLDLKEVASDDPITVIKYKCLAAGEGCVVEDTVLEIDGECVTDIRYKLSELQDRSTPSRLSWITTLGLITNGTLSVYQGVILGDFKPCPILPNDAFGFDPYFKPDGSDSTLYELELLGDKDLYSARHKAITALKNGSRLLALPISEIPPWTGLWQNEE